MTRNNRNHKKIKKELFHYIMDSLPQKRSREVDTHLEECETCRREKISIQNLMNGVKSKTGFSLSEQAFENAKAQMKKEYQKQTGLEEKENFIRRFTGKLDNMRGTRWILQPAALMMLAVLVSLVIFGVSILTQPNKLIAFNFPFSLFGAFEIS